MNGRRSIGNVPWLVVVLALAVVLGPGPLPAQAPAKKLEDAVKIKLAKREFTFTVAEAAKGIKIPYEIVVADDIPGVAPMPPGPSFNTPAGKSGLYPYIRITGNDQVYAPLDYGLGAPPEPQFQALKKGTYAASFDWDGRNWQGPSDTGQARGAAFPPGTYTITVTAVGRVKAGGVERQYTLTGMARLVLKKGE
jgi:hypothetical protein